MTSGVQNFLEILSLLAGVGYAVLAARRNRLCWIAGAVGSAILALVSGLGDLPMQAGLNIFYVVVSAYGWWNWTRSSTEGELPVSRWPLHLHLVAAIGITMLSYLSAQWLAERTHAAWPFLDSLTTWFSLFAFWLATQAKLENWLYWIAIDGVLVFLFHAQESPFIALQFAILMGIAAAGFVTWRRRLGAHVVPT